MVSGKHHARTPHAPVDRPGGCPGPGGRRSRLRPGLAQPQYVGVHDDGGATHPVERRSARARRAPTSPATPRSPSGSPPTWPREARCRPFRPPWPANGRSCPLRSSSIKPRRRWCPAPWRPSRFPEAPNGTAGSRGQHLSADFTTSFTVAPGSTFRLQQMLAELGLPAPQLHCGLASDSPTQEGRPRSAPSPGAGPTSRPR